MTEREQFESAMLESVIMPRPHLVAHIETIFERYDFGDCGYKQMWLDSAWIGWQAARATPALPQGVLDYGYSELFWAIAAAVEKTEPNVPRKISVRAFKEKLLSAPSDGVGSGTALPQGVELDAYDAGYLASYGEGNVGWWHDYMRAELERARCFYEQQVEEMLSGMAIVPVERLKYLNDHHHATESGVGLARLALSRGDTQRAIEALNSTSEKLDSILDVLAAAKERKS